MNYAIILAGPPGSGKTTLGKLLCQCLDNMIYLDQDMCSGNSSIYERRIRESLGKNLVLGKCHQNERTLGGVRKLLNQMNYGYRVYDMYSNISEKIIDVLVDRIKERKDHPSLKYSENTRNVVQSLIVSYQPWIHKDSVKIDLLEAVDVKLRKILDDLLVMKYINSERYKKSIEEISILLSRSEVESRDRIKIGKEYNHVKDINFIMCGDNDNYNPEIYEDAAKVIEKMNEYFKSRNVCYGTQSKYFRHLCDFYMRRDECSQETYEKYNSHVKKLDLLYRSEPRLVSTSNMIDDLEKLKEKIMTVMKKSKHSSVVILCSFFLNFDPNQRLMSLVDISDFMKTSVINDLEPKLNEINLNSGDWRYKKGLLKMSVEFVECVRSERSKTGINPQLLGRRLIGKAKNFTPYNNDNTSSISKLFSEECGISYSEIMKNLNYLYNRPLSVLNVHAPSKNQESEIVVNSAASQESGENIVNSSSNPTSECENIVSSSSNPQSPSSPDSSDVSVSVLRPKIKLILKRK